MLTDVRDIRWHKQQTKQNKNLWRKSLGKEICEEIEFENWYVPGYAEGYTCLELKHSQKRMEKSLSFHFV